MKIKLTEYFMKRPTLFWSLMTFILIAGVLAFLQMPKLEDPAVSVKQAMVIVPYPGATAHEVELKVAQTMEDELRALPNVKKIKSECQNGMATFTVEFQMTVLQKDLEQHFDLLRRKVNDSRSKLPQDCYDPIVIDDMMDVYGIFYAFTGEGYSYPELYKYAKLIRRELLGVKGVKRILITGNRDEVIQITLSKEKIARNGIIPTQIMMSLQNAGKTVNAGSYQNESDRLPLHVSSAVTDEKDIRNLLIRTPQGKTIRLGDIAQIERTYSKPQRNGFFVDGKPALAICLTMEENAIVPDVGKAVEKRLAEIMPQIPAGMEMEKIFFQPDKVDEAISSFMVNLVESVLIVILILIFTMGFRSGLIIGFGLILTIAVSFPILLMCGTTLQRISLGAFIVAMGMLVDNAIVIMDGILIDKARGLAPKTYLYRIGQHTAMPLLGATLIAVSTFLAVYLSPDSAGEYAGDLFLVLCVSLLASWILALIQVPVCAKSWLPVREKTTQQPQIYHSPIHRFIRRTISLLVEYKKTTLATAFILLALCIFGMTKVKNLFFPDFDYKQFIVEYFLPSQTDPDRVRKDLLEISALLKKNPAIERVAASMGSAPAHYCLVRPMTSGGDCYGELMVDCKDYETVVAQIPAIRKLLRERYPDAYIRIRKYNFSIASSHTVEVEFSGPDPAILRKLSQQAEDIMRRCPYVDPYSVGNNWKPEGKTLTADYVREDALRSGIERSDVGNALLAATDGLPVGVLNDQDRTVLIHLLVRNADGSRITNLNDIPVWSTLNLRMDDNELKGLLTGSTKMDELQDQLFRSVPLGNVARQIRLDWEDNYIYRLNGQRAIEAECDPNTDLYEATPAKVVASIQKEIEDIPLPDGYKMRWVGEGELQGEAIGNLMKYMPVTLFIILGILLLLFNSWKKVILILLCFPFVFCGITPALLLFRQPFTFMAIIGMMGLIGMMVKNAIVLVDEINRLQQEEHLHPYHAVVEATISRVRPVLMASLTTIVGMIPLVNDPMYGSMAITIMGGLTVGTLITLVLLPIFYTALFHIHKPNSMSNPSSKQL
ncbi:efflux RND transporter permease subunit [uncultured Bacteroides sp.]|uniref:efflux RND transporter permease subunit n=1 Tax=uncultured Bacteroides sp. TaxID=162156 RepID=UPI00258613E4|nr:efflux RND transporter permease subunit [uncultured Bacteroides sp.]